MTIPEPLPVTNAVFYVRDRQDWAVEQEAYRHTQPLYQFGEPSMFFLMWAYQDFAAGLVDRCSRCWSTENAVYSEVYLQPIENKCPYCYGTTFEGGIRARVIRPAFFTDADDVETMSTRGVVHPINVSIQTTSDFRTRNGDYVVRYDNSRWRLSAPTKTQLRSGYGHPSQLQDSIGYGMIPGALEDKSSVAYLLPPTATADVNSLLTSTSAFPEHAADIINGPLIPPLSVIT